METLTGKSYAITGGNGGIGLATAQELVQRSARVAIFGRNEQALAVAQRALGVTTLAVRKGNPQGDTSDCISAMH